MDTTILVDKQYEDGKKLIQKLDGQGKKYPIIAWINLPDKSGWTLLFGVPNLNATGAKETFKNFHNLIIKNNIEVSLNDISLVDTSDDICKSLRTAIKTGFGLSKISFFGNFINGHRFPDSIIYRVN
ncbi:MAG: hypothetical protein M3R72_00825 [Bacteroidota bacterium]|nr:hypothetical protein [Bacteroidota bacterium]